MGHTPITVTQVQSPRMTMVNYIVNSPVLLMLVWGFILYQGRKCLMATPDRANILRKLHSLLSNY
jgi:hypothetical protein